MSSKTLATIRAEVEYRSDMDFSTSSFITTTEANSYINDSCGALYDLIREVDPTLLLTTDDTTIVAGTASYSLPSDFVELIAVDWIDSASNKVSLRPVNYGERNRFQSTLYLNNDGNPLYCYVLKTSTIELLPDPAEAATLRLHYIPEWTDMDDDADTVDLPNHMIRWVVLDAAIKCVTKEESDPQLLMVEQAKAEQRIRRVLTKRDQNIPKGMYSVKRLNNPFTWR